MVWEKMEPIKDGESGCLCCGDAREILPMNAVIAVGFGSATVSKNGETVYDEGDCGSEEEYWTAQMAEDMAKVDPDNDWRIQMFGPLSESEYQRQGDGHWVLYAKGQGFA